MKNYIKNIKSLGWHLQQQKVPRLLYFQPDILDKVRTPREKAESGTEEFQNYLRMAKTAFRRENPPSGEFWKLKERFKQEKKEIFWDYIHPNNEGNQIISEIITEDIYKLLINEKN